MKNIPFLFARVAVLGGALFSSVAFAQPMPDAPPPGEAPIGELAPLPEDGPPQGQRGPGRRPQRGPGRPGGRRNMMREGDRPVPLPQPQDVLRGEAMYLERIAISPDAKLHVALISRVAGAEYLPVAAGIFPARNGITPFELRIPQGMAPAGPYRLQAWIVGDNRLMFQGRDPITTIASLDEPAKIMLKIAGAPRNIDGIGDGKPLPVKPGPTGGLQGVMPMFAIAKGQVVKLDRRALAPDAQVEVTISDVSRADAPAIVMAQRKFPLEGRQLPFNFELPVRADSRMMKPTGRYSISAKIYENGKLTYTTDTFMPVTQQNVVKPFELLVKSAR